PRRRYSPPRKHHQHRHPMTGSSMQSASLVRQSMSTPRPSPINSTPAAAGRHHQPPPKRVQAGSLVSADRQINSVIILIHYDEDVPDSRTYMEYDSLSSAMDGICRLYESALSDALAPRGEREDVSPSVEGERKRQRSVNYSAQDLFNYIDSMAAMKAFISHKATENGRVSRKATSNGFEDMLAPRGIKWIKENLIKHLRSQLDAPSMPPYTSTTAQ
ncbi:hypothetical protein FOZ62_026212, partial [Perkinsus olseni]